MEIQQMGSKMWRKHAKMLSKSYALAAWMLPVNAANTATMTIFGGCKPQQT
jgi:hypothetical protein